MRGKNCTGSDNLMRPYISRRYHKFAHFYNCTTVTSYQSVLAVCGRTFQRKFWHWNREHGFVHQLTSCFTTKVVKTESGHWKLFKKVLRYTSQNYHFDALNCNLSIKNWITSCKKWTLKSTKRVVVVLTQAAFHTSCRLISLVLSSWLRLSTVSLHSWLLRRRGNEEAFWRVLIGIGGNGRASVRKLIERWGK